MNRIICDDYNDVSGIATKIFGGCLDANAGLKIGLMAGHTAIGFYKNVSALCQDGKIDLSRVITFGLDEYYKIEDGQPSHYSYLNEHLFRNVNIKPENIHMPDGTACDPATECARYNALLDSHGSIDFLILGLGVNGHLGFNEPGDFLLPRTHETHLTEDTVTANLRFFENRKSVPRAAIAMGMADILNAKKILLLVSGPSKAAAIEVLFGGKITAYCPATFLNLHSDCTVILDKEAADRL